MHRVTGHFVRAVKVGGRGLWRLYLVATLRRGFCVVAREQ